MRDAVMQKASEPPLDFPHHSKPASRNVRTNH